MTQSFVVVMDSTRAATYTLAGRMGQLVKHGSMQSPAAHKHERDLGTDKAGRVVNRMGGVQHSLQARHSIKQQATAIFLRSLARTISDRLSRTDETLILVASPRLLGAIKGNLSDKTLARLHCQVPRDLVDVSPQALLQKLRQATARFSA